MRDRVTPKTALAVFTRDGECVAVKLGAPAAGCRGRLTLDHVRAHPMMGKRAPSRPESMVALCEGHHLDTRAGANWATSHRPELRLYLASVA